MWYNMYLKYACLCVLVLIGWTDTDKEHLGQELSDVLIYLVRLAERCHIDLPTAVLKKFELNGQKYPVDKVYGSSRKYTEYETGTSKTDTTSSGQTCQEE